MNSSQDSKGFMGLYIPIDNLQDMVMSKMEELVDYEDSKKDNQRCTDGSGEGNPLADESGNNNETPDESLVATIEARDYEEEVPVVSGPFDSINARMSEVHGLPRGNKPQARLLMKLASL